MECMQLLCGRHALERVRPVRVIVLGVVAFVAMALLVGVVAGPPRAVAAADDTLPGQTLAVGATVSGSVSAGDDTSDVFGVPLVAGEEVRLFVRSRGETYARGTVHLLALGTPSLVDAADYELVSLRMNQSSSTYSEYDQAYVPPRTGTYFLWIEGTERTLDYELRVTRSSMPALPAVDSDDIPGLSVGTGVFSGVVDTLADRNDVYATTLLADRPVRLELKAAGSGPLGVARLYLVTPDSTSVGDLGSRTIIDSAPTAPDRVAVIEYTPDVTGVYYLWVRAGVIRSNVAYRLRVSGVAEQPPGNPYPPPVPFPDVPAEHPYHEAITGIAEQGIINGYASGLFGVDESVRRAQFVKMICGTLDMMVTEDLTSPFTDLGDDVRWDLYPHEYVAAAYANGITNGLTGTTFGPYDRVTRAQAVTMIVRAAQNLRPGALAPVPSGYEGTVASFSDVHTPYMRIAEFNGLLAGLQGFAPAWDPWAGARRGEAAQMLWNLLRHMDRAMP